MLLCTYRTMHTTRVEYSYLAQSSMHTVVCKPTYSTTRVRKLASRSQLTINNDTSSSVPEQDAVLDVPVHDSKEERTEVCVYWSVYCNSTSLEYAYYSSIMHTQLSDGYYELVCIILYAYWLVGLLQYAYYQSSYSSQYAQIIILLLPYELVECILEYQLVILVLSTVVLLLCIEWYAYMHTTRVEYKYSVHGTRSTLQYAN